MGLYGSPDLTQINNTQETKKNKNPFKILLFVVLCIPVIFIVYILTISTIKTTSEMMYKEKYLTSEEFEAIQYIRNKTNNLGISIEEYINLIKKYELEK